MSNHQQRYKKKPVGFVDANAGRMVRTIKLEERRKLNRAENYAKNRDVPNSPENEEIPSTSVSREVKFQRWKAERDLQKKIEKQKKKPVFKVGVVHHKFYSPVHSKTNVQPVPCHGKGVRKEKHQPTPPKRITRATQKRLEAKQAGIATPGIASTSGLKSKRTKSIRKPKLPSPRKKTAFSFAPENYSFKAPAGVAEVPLFGRFAIPKDTETDKSITGNNIDGASENEDEQPWPHATHPPVDIMDTQKLRNSFTRQNAPEQISTDSFRNTRNRNSSNSSIEELNLKLSSEDESPGDTEEPETTEPKNAATRLDFSAIPEKIDEPPNYEEVMALVTPPRSGSPAPASFSPYIVSSRGKNSARKEQQSKMGIRRSLSGSKIPTKDTVMQNLNISVEEEEQTAQYFKFILESTIENLRELCNKWEEIMQDPDLPEDAQYRINQAIGQTNLLMRKKFERFRKLVLDCETGKGEMLVTCKDLQGFWDMMYIEVDNCKTRFLQLDILRSKDWVEEQIAAPNKKLTKKKTVAPKPKIAAKSSARSWILAARKKMTQPEDSGDNNKVSAEDTKSPTREVQDRRRSTPKSTPRKTPVSLRKIVQLTQASKSIHSPLAAMKISKMWKTPEVTLDNTISYVNSDQTPAKGILKKSEGSSDSETSVLKSTRKVDFNDDVFLDEVAAENEVSEELQNSLDLGRALAIIDSYDDGDDDEEDIYSDVESNFMKNVTIRKVEKRLDFEDESFVETENTDTGEAIVAETPETPALVDEIPEAAAIYEIPSTVPKLMIIPSTPIQAAGKTERTSLNTSELLETSIQEEIPESSLFSTRVLRNRTVTAKSPLKPNRRSIKSPARDRQMHNSSIKENCDPLREGKDATNENASHNVKEESTSKEQAKPRRSTRKSIRLGADECTTCTPKPVLPSTPHSIRSRKISVAGENSRKSVGAGVMEDLISFDSPIQRPPRNRRSSFK